MPASTDGGAVAGGWAGGVSPGAPDEVDAAPAVVPADSPVAAPGFASV